MNAPFDVAACCRCLEYEFRNPDLLIHALTHSSIKSRDLPSNERMEFLGDAILGQEVSLYLFKKYKRMNEGELTKIKSVVVSRAVIAEVCQHIGMQEFILVGKGIKRDHLPLSLYANIFEGLIAAIYLDSGIRAARKFIRATLIPEIEKVVKNDEHKNYKSLLQHFAQKHLHATPVYKLASEIGPDHDKTFEVQVEIANKTYAHGSGPNKKLAEQQAAANTLDTLNIS